MSVETVSKIRSLSELAGILEEARKAGRRIVLCHGVFDLLHPGHILHLKKAREQGDLLVVTVTPDQFVRKGPGRPVFNQRLRLETLAALQDIDYTALNEWPTSVETISLLKPHVYVKGSDYSDSAADLTGRIVEEEAAVKSVGGEIFFTDGEVFSSSHLINRFFSAYPDKTQEYLSTLRSRYGPDQIIEVLKGLAGLKVLVVGEAILDQYCYCIPMGKSPKETIVSTRFSEEEQFAGGSLAVANHLAGFCGEVTLITLLGPDKAQAGFIRSKLRPNVRLEAVASGERPTIIKRRFLEPSFLTKMFEIQYLNDTPLSGDLEQEVRSRIERHLAPHDFLVMADFGHGLMTPSLREFVSSAGKFLALNTQSNSANLGFNPVTKYPRADFVSLDEPELKLAVQTKYGDLFHLAMEVKQRLQTASLLVSRGPGGSLILSDQGLTVETPALAVKVVDRIGAGDALFSVTAPCVFQGIPSDLVGFIGNCAGALAVETVCNREPVDPVLLYKFIRSVLK
ncbi:MAG: adenylyltransferase/cytidyltransferase family protein [Candidatus Omnitrophica bacterium]|nr:adenylyltransferase/cytidyltransferase family protein [Candidatus Omnitrophota bacterium]